jgi:hypothetical protein
MIMFHSAYRLVLIIANEWFQYFQEWHPKTSKVNTEAFEMAAAAYRLWASGDGVQEIPWPDGRKGCRVANPPK